MGTPDFSIPILDSLHNNFDLVAVYSQPPNRKGRGKKVGYTPVHQRSLDLGIPVETPISLKNSEELNKLKKYQVDAIIVAAYGLILPKDFLDYPPLGCINIHASLLPRWRGAAPIQRAILFGDKETGITIMKMDSGLDTGQIIIQDKINITEKTNFKALHDKLSNLGSKMIISAIRGLSDSSLKLTDQSDNGITYAKKITKNEQKILFNKPAVDVIRQINSLSPYPCAYIMYKGERIKFIKAEYNMSVNGKPGYIIDKDFNIGCENGSIRPTEVQRMGKKPMNIDTFLRGFNIINGSKLD